MEINLLSLHKIVDSLVCVILGDNWKTIANLQGLKKDDGEAVKGCYKKFIDMVQVYYETTKMPWYEKKPKEDVVESSSCNARIKDPQGKEKDDAGIEETLEEDMNKKTQFGVRLGGNMEEKAEEGSTTDNNDFVYELNANGSTPVEVLGDYKSAFKPVLNSSIEEVKRTKLDNLESKAHLQQVSSDISAKIKAKENRIAILQSQIDQTVLCQ
ncbi:hypothetical protein Tco_0862816, partial [Tanacetum coccineum]